MLFYRFPTWPASATAFRIVSLCFALFLRASENWSSCWSPKRPGCCQDLPSPATTWHPLSMHLAALINIIKCSKCLKLKRYKSNLTNLDKSWQLGSFDSRMELVNHLKSIAFPGVTLIYMQSGINGTQWARWWRNIPAIKPQSLNLYKFDLDRVGLIFQLWFPSLAGCRCATYSTKMSWSVALPAVVERPNFRILNWMNRMNNDVILVQPCIRGVVVCGGYRPCAALA